MLDWEWWIESEIQLKMNLKSPLEPFLTLKKIEVYFNLGQEQKLIHFCEIFLFHSTSCHKMQKWTQLKFNIKLPIVSPWLSPYQQIPNGYKSLVPNIQIIWSIKHIIRV